MPAQVREGAARRSRSASVQLQPVPVPERVLAPAQERVLVQAAAAARRPGSVSVQSEPVLEQAQVPEPAAVQEPVREPGLSTSAPARSSTRLGA